MVDDTVRNSVPQISVWAIYDNVEIANVGGASANGYGGIYIGQGGTTAQYFRTARIREFFGIGLKGRLADGISFENSTIEKISTTYDTDKNFIECEGCNNLAIRHSRFEGRNLKTTPYVRIFGEYMGALIDACSFRQRGDAVDLNDLKAILHQGIHRGTTISSIEVRIPGNASLGDGEHIRINGATATGVEPEALVGPCGLKDGTSGTPVPRLRVFSDSRLASLQAVALRHRIIRITTADRDGLLDKQPGELIYNYDVGVNKAQMWDGLIWRDLW
jgi:hypothetical protein